MDACRVCGGERYRVALREAPYEVRRCEACGFGWVSPRLSEDELAALYSDESYWTSAAPKDRGYGDYRADEELYLRTFRRRLDRVLRDGPSSGRALDVGCAAGFCLRALAERGFEVHGVEISPAIAPSDFPVHVGTLETSPYAPATFDLITMWDVIEHVVDFHALLRRARELLAPGGLLVLETQDISSVFARVLGRRWHHYKHAEHIYHFTPATLRRVLSDCGFAVLDIGTRSAGKDVSTAFVAERAGRLHPALPRVLAPLARRDRALYVNLHDEMIVRAR